MTMTRREFVVGTFAGVGGAALADDRTSSTAGKEGPVPTALNLRPVADDVVRVPVYGISEWMCYYSNYNVPLPDSKIDSVIEECVDLHRAVGFSHMVWNCGRSTIDYHSDLPGTTRMCELSDKAGGKSWAFVAKVQRRGCPLRRAMAHCRKLGMSILGRLGMNRHYGSKGSLAVTSRFRRDHPQYVERGRNGEPISSRLCYAIPEVQQERLDILLELQRIGVDALVPDYCRQMPVLDYHEALVKPFMAKTGVDPRTIDSGDPDDYAAWFQYRADVLTGFMRRLRRAVREQERRLGRPCPIIPRVPDSAPWLMIAYGLDTVRWLKEDLIDATMLSPFPRCREDLKLYPEHHIRLAHERGRACIGGLGSKELIRNGVPTNTGFYHVQPALERVARQYRAGADAISVYQSETLIRMDYLKDLLKCLGDRKLVVRRAEELPEPKPPASPLIGLDWHTRLKNGESLRSAAGAYAL